jgi:uncharacterized protein
MPTKKKSSHKPVTRQQNKEPDLTRSDLVDVRNSPIHGRGVYAAKAIKKGTRIYEYVGERITHSEADRRFALKPEDDGHTFLFVVNHKTVIDGSHSGNDARYINHRCDANCETITEGNRIFIEAIRDIKKGQELGYDYQLTWSDYDDPEDLKLYACRCGSRQCRGTMLDKLSLEQNRARDRAKKKRAQARAAAKKSTKKTTVRTKRGTR